MLLIVYSPITIPWQFRTYTSPLLSGQLWKLYNGSVYTMDRYTRVVQHGLLPFCRIGTRPPTTIPYAI